MAVYRAKGFVFRCEGAVPRGTLSDDSNNLQQKKKAAVIHADLKDEQDWRHWSFRYERNLRRSRWEGAENPFVTACK